MQESEGELSFEELIEGLTERLQDVEEPNAVDLRLEELHEVTTRLEERLDEEEVHLLEDDYSAKSGTRTRRGTMVKRNFVIEFFFSIYRLVEALLQELFGTRQTEEDADEDMDIKAYHMRSFARHDSFITQKSFWQRIDDVKGDGNVTSIANADGSTELSHAHVDGIGQQ
ncbi:hypothetical protein NDN08_000146 [Rhodosorus marinus]|uniref:Uncharacterized protein n=1 Tax=Rhodosorus marinus TaxID=101924 RepID=A0AAV8UI24_9RHOD|nr:hypothetical protein NDN08_000146 [Rhodosorus marinus]